jgi:uracil-DNA glycosylase
MPLPLSPKAIAYAELVAERKRCRLCAELTNLSKYKKLDSDHIGPYSRWQGNLDAKLLVIGQDSSDIDTYLNYGGDWPGHSVETNVNLVELMSLVGIDISLPRRDHPDDRYFFTNAVLCLKKSDPRKKRSMRGKVKPEYFRNCGERFLRRTIELVQPRAVATLGEPALAATLSAFGLPPAGSFRALLDSGRTFPLSCGARLFPMCHPNFTVRYTYRSLEKQTADWKRLARWLRAA